MTRIIIVVLIAAFSAAGQAQVGEEDSGYADIKVKRDVCPDSPLPIVIETKPPGTPVFFIPHANEETALETARLFLSRLGGTIVRVDCKEGIDSSDIKAGKVTKGSTKSSRYCNVGKQQIDPNRYLCHDGPKATEGSKKFWDCVYPYFENEPMMYALHCNVGIDRGSQINCVNPYPGTEPQYCGPNNKDAIDIYPGPGVSMKKPDTRLNEAGQRSMERIQEFSSCLKEKNINQVYESAFLGDCSMSEQAARMGRPYVNVETKCGTKPELLQYPNLLNTMVCADKIYGSVKTEEHVPLAQMYKPDKVPPVLKALEAQIAAAQARQERERRKREGLPPGPERKVNK